MQRRLTVVAIAFFFATFVGVSHPATAATGKCISGTNTFTVTDWVFDSAPFSVNVGDVVSVTMSGSGTPFITIAVLDGFSGYLVPHTMLNAGSTFVRFLNALIAPGAGTIHWQISVNGGCSGSATGDDEVTFWEFEDGRVNSHDGAQTAAVYCEDDGGVAVYAVIKSVGYLAFKVSADELDELPEHPEQNTLIKSGKGVSLYELTTGELQVNGSDNYVFTWDGC